MLRHVAADALAGRQMHPKSRRGIDLDDTATGFAERLTDIGRYNIHSRHVEADDLGNALEQKDVLGMDLVRAIDRRTASRNVGGGFKTESFVHGQYAVKVVTGLSNAAHRLIVDVDLCQ